MVGYARFFLSCDVPSASVFPATLPLAWLSRVAPALPALLPLDGLIPDGPTLDVPVPG
jgi:hypothetical protein